MRGKWKVILGFCLLFSVMGAAAQETFTTSKQVDGLESVANWEAKGENYGPQTAINLVKTPVVSGNGAAELVYDFIGATGKINYCEYLNQFVLPTYTKKLSFWVYGDNSGHALKVRLTDKTWEVFQYNIGKIDWSGWRQVSINLDEVEGHWGGDEDGLFTDYIMFRSFLIDIKDRSFIGRGKIYVDDLVAQLTVPAQESVLLDLESGKVGNIFTADEEVKFNLTFNNISDKARNLEFSYWVTSTDGRAVANNTLNINVRPGGVQTRDLIIPIKLNGTYRLEVYLRSDDRVIRFQREVPFSRVSPLIEERGAGLFGIGTHIATGQVDYKTTIDLVALAGAQWIRDEMYWGRAERVKGKIEVWPEWDEWVDYAIEKGLEPLLILNYGNKFYDEGGAPYTPEGIEAYCRYAATIVEHFKGRIKYFEIWNEWNYGFGMTTVKRPPEDYAKLIKAVYPVIKAVNPEAVVIGGVTSHLDLAWHERVLNAGAYDAMDAVSIHPYCYPSSPDAGGLERDLALLRDLFTRFGGAKPIFITEVGYPNYDHPQGVSEAVAAAYAVRTYVLGMASGVTPVISWYDLQNDGTDKKDKEHNFGMLLSYRDEAVTWAAKETFISFNAMTEQLVGAKFVEEIQLTPNIRSFRFLRETDGQEVLVIWTLNGTETIGLDIGKESIKAVDLYGNSVQLKTTAGVLSLAVNESPQYLVGKFCKLELTEPLFKPAAFEIDVVAGEVIPFDVDLVPSTAGQFFADLPRGWQLVGDRQFAADAQKAQLQLKTAPEAQIGKNYEFTLFPVAENSALSRLTMIAKVKEPIEVTVTPLLVDQGTWQKGQLAVTLTNHSTSQTLEGTIKLSAPATWAAHTELLSFAGIGPAMNKTIFLPLPTIPQQELTTVALDVDLRGGRQIKLNRKVSFLAARRATTAPKLDGVVSQEEWGRAMPFTLEQEKQVQRIEKWGGPQDLSGKGYLMWDEQYLYLAMVVKDDQHQQKFADGNIWQGDGIQFTLDPARNRGPGLEGYTEMGVALGEAGPMNWRWNAPYGRQTGTMANAKVAINREATTTSYEVAIPWSEIVASGTKIEPGLNLGFSLLINEDDGKGRQGWIEYMSGIGAGKDPDSFGDVVLMD